eukprot:Sspe_Gene.71488::Locus_42398_Transcript_1_1_Confidence_1.000_Length_2456::g.71488::m.71488
MASVISMISSDFRSYSSWSSVARVVSASTSFCSSSWKASHWFSRELRSRRIRSSSARCWKMRLRRSLISASRFPISVSYCTGSHTSSSARLVAVTSWGRRSFFSASRTRRTLSRWSVCSLSLCRALICSCPWVSTASYSLSAASSLLSPMAAARRCLSMARLGSVCSSTALSIPALTSASLGRDISSKWATKESGYLSRAVCSWVSTSRRIRSCAFRRMRALLASMIATFVACRSCESSSFTLISRSFSTSRILLPSTSSLFRCSSPSAFFVFSSCFSSSLYRSNSPRIRTRVGEGGISLP